MAIIHLTLMKKKLLCFVSLSVAGVVLLLFALYLSADVPNKRKNGFSRHWLPSFITPLHQAKPSLPVTRISGAASSHLFFSTNNPSWALMTDYALHTVDTLFLNIQPSQKMLSFNKLEVDSPHIYVYANNLSLIISGKVDTSYVDTTGLQTLLFTRSARISDQSLVIRGLDSSFQQQVFKKMNCYSRQAEQQALIIDDQKDMGFSSDGFLEYDSLTSRIIYVEMFRNQFYCLDTNLQQLYIGKTIDTVSINNAIAKIKTTKEDTKLEPSGSRTVVNQGCWVDNGYIYILAGLKADNESMVDFKKSTTVDIYQVKDGLYRGSFHIPDFNKKKVLFILVRNNFLLAMYSDYQLATFLMNTPLQPT